MTLETEARSGARRDPAILRDAIIRKLTYDVGRSQNAASDREWFIATARAVRDLIVDRWMATTRSAYETGAKQVYYLSLEFLIGRLLRDNIDNLGLTEQVNDALAPLGVTLERIRMVEHDAALGNGGLGRLAACFMESMASLGVPAFGYGIRYDHGLFRQVIVDGWQHEYPEDWLAYGNPWEFAKPEICPEISFGGWVEGAVADEPCVWRPDEQVHAVAYDTPVVGWRGRSMTTLRLWSARAPDPLKLEAFNRGDHVGALADRVRLESISKVLYPGDETPSGQELRLRQQYFFTSAALQDLVRRHLRVYGDLASLPDRVAIQLNDTHPAIAVAELMRICVDLHQLPWDEAWRITRGSFGYTNHTLMPEALESWPVALMERLLPRHMQIIYVINARHLDDVRARFPGDDALAASVSLIHENAERRVRMGHLAFLGSHRVNGVSALHTDLLRRTVFHDLDRVAPGRIVGITNGITFRRWLHQANRRLCTLIEAAIGPRFRDDPQALEELVPLAEDAGFRGDFALVKRLNKQALAEAIRGELGIAVDPTAMMDVQIKRIHEYKRQLLNLLETIALAEAIRADPAAGWAPRVKVFAGKAAASYHRAKLIIKLAHDVGAAVNGDPALGGLLKVVFLPNYNVSAAELIVPAADLSEQISTAGMEASGTGNMKLALNGALTIGTRDGATVEIAERVPKETMFLFGLSAEEVAERRARGVGGWPAIAASPRLAAVLEALEQGAYSPDDPGRYRDLVASLRGPDPFMVAADFEAYWAAQRRADRLWQDRSAWIRAAVLNTANMAWFSADRTIAEYAAEVWNIPVHRRPLVQAAEAAAAQEGRRGG
ncbi:glycogen/starch/alpha-glucan phosphorylase [Elioraea sp. Yellowstone]|uniref:glycogen/starch/alpha-glucan phosphorylase n=1 Tax=Elioraea sp. Yellowstone TaxID=2592070 RepID=UPI001153D4F4|nr:glycogen/starch/alpha-glucan phosphorylase [Elioraea sp. Yellowstone]TQF79152.1 glycogen/starch/alpha-glucan phosphorylase [Elioraea sp. Yellowstone]